MMTLLRKPLHYLLTTAVLLMSLVATALPAHAMENGTLSFAANKTTLKVGEQVTVSVNLAVAGTPGAGSIELIVNFDAAKLNLVNVNSTGSIFQAVQEEIITANKLTTSRYNTSGGTTGGKVLDLIFQATAEGTASVSFDAGSRIWEAGTGICASP